MAIKLSVIVPCYNEQTRFKNGFNHYYSFLKKQRFSWELIFVNDGSNDKTLGLMRDYGKKDKRIKVITYHKNHGKGYAVVQGVKITKGDYILFTDIDHSVPISTINSFFLSFNEGTSVVIGSRRVRGAKILARQPKIRELLGQGFTILVRILIDFKVRDATCGFKVFKKDLAKELFPKITIYDWAFDAEVLFLCKKMKEKYIQAPVSWSEVRGSQVRLKKDVIRSLAGLVRIRFNNFKGAYNK